MARKRIAELFRFALTDLRESDGAGVDGCIKAVFDAYFKDGSVGMERVLKMLEK